MRSSFSVQGMIRFVSRTSLPPLIFSPPFFQTDEDMFRALLLFPPGATKAIMDPPLSVTLIDKDPSALQPVELAIKPEAVFTTTVGHNTKRTLASWHVTSPAEVIDHMLGLVGLDRDTVAKRKDTTETGSGSGSGSEK
jgi:trehalose 6-phosphate synthase/phosphatase